MCRESGDGIVGDITHCTAYRAVVARAHEIRTIGTDAKPNDRLPDGVLDLISRQQERAMLAGLAAVRDIRWDRLLFSAKESAYKPWFRLTRRWLGFEDAGITISPGTATYNAILLPLPTVGFSVTDCL